MRADTLLRVAGADRQLEWVRAVVAHGVRRPGSAQGREVLGWLVAELEGLGLTPTLQPVPLLAWEGEHAELTVWPADDPAARTRFRGMPVPFTTGGSATGPLVPYGDARGLAGALALETIELEALSQSELLAGSSGWVDLDGTLAVGSQLIPFGPQRQQVTEPAIEGGALGFVGLLRGVPWDTHSYYVPYDGVERPLPGIWLSRDCGLDRLLGGAPLQGHLETEGRCFAATDHNVVVELPGASDECVVIGTHYDAPWASAVEDGTGIAMVLAQAAYWSALPQEERPHGLVFLFTAGHMSGGAGTQAFMARNPELLERTVCALHLEHAAAEVEPDGSGGIRLTGRPETRWWFTSESAALQTCVRDALVTEELSRSILLPPEYFQEFPPTDGGALHLAGVPLVNFLSAPPYLFDAIDTLDKVHVASLEPLAKATVRIVGWLGGTTGAQLRQGLPRSAARA